MRAFGQGPESASMVTTAAAPAGKEIPYDYVARFQLKGEPGNRVRDVINVSVEGAFVAAAIGYSFIPAKLQQPAETDLDDVILRLNAPLHDLWQAFEEVANPPAEILRCIAARLCGIDFKYSIVDSASGRELQNQPIHSVAGLGESAGFRPFRPFAKPMLFLPRSTIRIEVEEVSRGKLYGYVDSRNQQFGAELYIVLHGYKILGYGAGPQ